jgi:DDE superfamily endonuclease
MRLSFLTKWVWRFALLHRGWWRRTQRYRLPTHPLSPRHIKREEALKRQVWTQHRAWSRISSGVLLHVIGAIQYGTSEVFSKIVPHFDAQELRQYIHQVMATFQKTKKEVVMVVDRSGLHWAHKLDATLDHYHGTFRCHFLPARCGHHLNPHRRFLARAERCHRRGPVFKRSAAALQAHMPSAQGTSRTANRCMRLVAYSASNFAGSAHTH